VVTHLLQLRVQEKVHQPETDVLPLCYTTNNDSIDEYYTRELQFSPQINNCRQTLHILWQTT